jgi:hypothetical protein
MQPFIEERGALPENVKTFVRLLAGIQEEAEAIEIYEQRIDAEEDEQAEAIVAAAQQEEMKHFAMQLAQACRLNSKFYTICQAILFKEGDIVELGKKAEELV